MNNIFNIKYVGNVYGMVPLTLKLHLSKFGSICWPGGIAPEKVKAFLEYIFLGKKA